MKRIETTYAKLFDLYVNSGKAYYVKDYRGELTPIRAVGKKRSDTWMIDFDNGYQIRASGRHAFMNASDGNPILVESLKPNDKIKTIDGNLIVKSRHSHIEDQDVYDINVDSPHWYVNDEVGIIHHNTVITLVCAKAYLDKYDDAVMIFYDSEMGASKNYFESVGIDPNRVLYVPITNIEELKFDLMAQLEQIKRGDHVIIVVDSVGNLASKKEVEDALSEKSAADMTRAKQLKSLTRMITPHLNLKNIPMIVVAHVYKEMSLFPKDIVSGGTGLIYSSNQIFIITRSQEKKGTDLIGYNFNINIEKSRLVREKSRIPLTVTFDGGINRWSGLLEMALASGDVIKPSNGWYQKVDPETGEILERKYRAAETNTAEFWDSIIHSESFKDWVKRTFRIANDKLIKDDLTVSDSNDSIAQFTSEEAS